MRRKPILMATGFILVAFALGVGVGSRFGRRPADYRDSLVSQQAASGSSIAQTGSVASIAAGAESAPCVDIRSAGPLVGKRTCVAGLVLRVYTAQSGNTFLDFCQDYRACPFTSVVFAADKNKFGDLGSLQGKRVELRGDVVSYQGRAEIIIHDAHQVRSAP